MVDTVEISTILDDADFSRNLNTVSTLGNTVTRAEIEAVIAENSLPLPVNDVRFYIINTSRFFFITYDSIADRYMYVQLSAAA